MIDLAAEELTNTGTALQEAEGLLRGFDAAQDDADFDRTLINSKTLEDIGRAGTILKTIGLAGSLTLGDQDLRARASSAIDLMTTLVDASGALPSYAPVEAFADGYPTMLFGVWDATFSNAQAVLSGDDPNYDATTRPVAEFLAGYLPGGNRLLRMMGY